MTSRLTTMECLCVKKDITCIMMVPNLPNIVWNFDVHLPVENMVVVVNIPVPILNMAELFLWLWKTIQEYLISHHETAKYGKKEYHARTSVERSNKREKIDFKLEDGRHRSTKMWYCHLYHILMLQHLDAWDLPKEFSIKKLILRMR